MSLVLLALSAILGVLFLWGMVSPRSQWYALVGWTRSDPRETEPGSFAYGVSRVFSGIGLLALVAIGGGTLVGQIDWNESQRSRPLTEAEQTWGEPRSFVVDRVFTPLARPPAALVEQAVTGYQTVDGATATPRYLWELGKIRAAGLAAQPGFLGVEPLPDTLALDTADVVVHVRGDDRCIPQQVMVVPSDGAVQVAVYFGHPAGAEGQEVDPVNCDPGPPVARTRAYLIPIDLAAPLGDRVLQSATGEPIPVVLDAAA